MVFYIKNINKCHRVVLLIIKHSITNNSQPQITHLFTLNNASPSSYISFQIPICLTAQFTEQLAVMRVLQDISKAWFGPETKCTQHTFNPSALIRTISQSPILCQFYSLVAIAIPLWGGTKTPGIIKTFPGQLLSGQNKISLYLSLLCQANLSRLIFLSICRLKNEVLAGKTRHHFIKFAFL